jgi:hypothetical protein
LRLLRLSALRLEIRATLLQDTRHLLFDCRSHVKDVFVFHPEHIPKVSQLV